MTRERTSTNNANQGEDAVADSALPALRTVEEAGLFLGLSKSSVRRLTREGRLGAVKPFGTGEIRFRLEDLQAFVDSLRPVNQSGGKPAR